jgi:hypothetical protein
MAGKRRTTAALRFVEGRLRLADPAPVVFETLGAGAIALAAAIVILLMMVTP